MTKISEILYGVDSQQLMVPRFQRGWVWQKKHVLQLFDSLYQEYPVGSLITWPTQVGGRPVENVIDGQQRLTALYGIIRGERPPWFTNEAAGALEQLMFNVETETFKYATQAMQEDPLWADVTSLFKSGLGAWSSDFKARSHEDAQGIHYERIAQVIGIRDKDINVDKLPADVKVEAAAEVFKIVNRAGTRVSDGDLVLGQISLKWDEARLKLTETLEGWRNRGYGVSLEWLLHAMAAALEGKIDFNTVLLASRDELVTAFESVSKSTSEVLNHLRDTLGLDATLSTSVNNGLIVVVIDRLRQESGATKGLDHTRALIGWWLLSTLHNRWTGDIRNRTNRDLHALDTGNGIPGLMQELRGMAPSLRIGTEGFTRNRSAKPFYRLLITLTRRRGARDLGSGISLSFDHLGDNMSLEAHHIFPRGLLSEHGIQKAQIDQLANLALITKGTNLRIGKRSPAEYLPRLEATNPGVLESQWIPSDPDLWVVDAYRDFLEERCRLLAKAAEDLVGGLLGEYWQDS